MKSEYCNDTATRIDESRSVSVHSEPSSENMLEKDMSLECAESTSDQVVTLSVTDRIIHSLRRATSFAELTRLTGALLIVLALSLFLMQGVDATNDLQRYHLLLLQTSLLCAAGFAVGFLLKEPRGARVFFSLGLISIPANLAVLGAMVYSIMPSSQLSAHYPDYANWQASTLSEICIALVTGFVVIVPLCLFTFSVLARQSRVWLTCGFLFSSSMLLLPVRDSISIAVISTALAVCMVALIKRRQSAGATTLTLEERFSRALLFLPPALMLARSAVLYYGDSHIGLAVLAVIYILLRQWSGHCTKISLWSNTLHVVTSLTAVLLAGSLSTLDVANISIPGAAILFMLILGGLLLDLSRTVASDAIRWWMHTGWALLCIPVLVGHFMFRFGATAFVFSLLLPAIMMGSGFAFRNRLVTFLGVLGTGGSILLHGDQILRWLLGSDWVTVAMVGAAVVVSGSLIERYGVVIKLKVTAFMKSHSTPGRETDKQLENVDGPDIDQADESEKSLAA